jgi:hypothetical protein
VSPVDLLSEVEVLGASDGVCSVINGVLREAADRLL